MVFRKLLNGFKGNENCGEKYEILYHKYSELKSQIKTQENKAEEEKRELKDKLIERVTEMLLNLEDDVEEMKNTSFKISAKDKETQKLLININKVEKTMNEILSKLNIEPIIPEERFYDPELHEVSSYTTPKGIQKGVILKTVKKGWKYKNKVLRKPKVLVSN